MNSLWDDADASRFGDDPVQMRVYTSRLLGREPSLVLHGGGNTSVKCSVENIFGDREEILYIKGSGGDLATIEANGFAPVRMEVLTKMAQLERLTDTEMVRLQRAAMIDPYAPNPSVEAILHAIIPFRYVDHTHADSVVAITNTPGGDEKIRMMYGPRVLVIPYVMPGFVLARAIADRTLNIDWASYDGIVLLNHGVFTFADDARASYERMIAMVTMAEEYISSNKASAIASPAPVISIDLKKLATMRRAVSKVRGTAVIARLDSDSAAIGYSNLESVSKIAGQGPLTPDHIIRTKRIPLFVGDDIEASVRAYERDYQSYFERHRTDSQTMLDAAPRWAVWPGAGTVTFGVTTNEASIVTDIVRHTRRAQQWSEALGGWRALPEKDLFEMEYWELEQAKLKKTGSKPLLQGRIAIVTGAASGIGKATVRALESQGAVVAALDINPEIESGNKSANILPIACDLTDGSQVSGAIERTVREFGGLDILVSNAGNFPPSATIADLDPAVWQQSMALNLTSHQVLMAAAFPYLALGWEPSVVIVGSKNVAAPGPGAAAYSVAKAGLDQLARVAALEWAPFGVRVNTVHPNAVFDTAIWTKEVLEKRAAHYGQTVEEYKTSNLLHVEITSHDVAAAIAALAGPTFSRTTGAQIPIDGGNDRVI